jgi:pseudaminic acid cytidylyltransferase
MEESRMTTHNPVVIIPARGGSKRLPRKNILPIGGKPMIHWPIEACLKSGVFSDVIVSTEDPEIFSIAEKGGARVIKRPDHMATDEIHEGHATNHVLDTLKNEGKEPEFFLIIYSTAILVTPEDIQHSYALTQSTSPIADAVMSMSPYPNHPYKAHVKNEQGYLVPMFPKEVKERTQTYPHVSAVNGTFCWCRTEVWHKNMHYFPERFVGYEMPLERAVDVDTLEDYERLQTFFKMKGA